MDLLIELSEGRIGVEAELTARRIPNDLRKAMELEVDELWIVVPQSRTARSLRSALDRQRIRHGRRGLFVFTLGQAVQRLTKCFALFSASLSPTENKKQIDHAANERP